MSAEALRYLREQFGEGWTCTIEFDHDFTKVWCAFAGRLDVDARGVQVDGEHSDDPMSAAKACVEAWREATKGCALLAEMTYSTDLKDERAHADRLAEALASAAKEVRRLLPHCGALYKALDIICDSVAAHDARRAGR